MSIDSAAVLITGGAGGIGSAIAKQLLLAGHDVTVIDKVRPEIEEVAFIHADCEVPGATEQAVREAMENRDHGGLVNAIGYYGCSDLDHFSWEECDKSWQINARAPVEATVVWAQLRSKLTRGVVVNIGSAGARLGSRDLSYAMSKAAIEGATRSLARSLANQNCTVVCVAPGLIDTAMSQAMPARRRDEHAAGTLLGRPGQPNEVADLVVFLLLGRSEYLSGSTINMSCGLLW